MRRFKKKEAAPMNRGNSPSIGRPPPRTLSPTTFGPPLPGDAPGAHPERRAPGSLGPAPGGGSATPGTPPVPPEKPDSEPGPATAPKPEPPLKPRSPGVETPAEVGEGQTPTDVHIDVATGEIAVKKGPVTLRVAKYDPNNPPDKVKHLSEKEQRQWVHVYNSAADNGDDEETAHKKAWGAVPDKNKKNKESAGMFEHPMHDDPMQDLPERGRDSTRDHWFEAGKQFAESGGLYEEAEQEAATILNNGMGGMVAHDSFLAGFNAGSGVSEEMGAGDPRHVDEDLFGDFDRFAKKAEVGESYDRPFEKFLRTNKPEYGSWNDNKTQYSEDTWDDPFAHPKNRREPPQFTITAKVPDYMNAKGVAYSLQVGTTLDVEVNGQTLTINGVSEPLALITELESHHIEANLQGENLQDLANNSVYELYKGQKVAVLKDLPQFNYFPGENQIVEARVVGQRGEDYVVSNDMWGSFTASREELDVR